ncbi:DUF3267 domain-containing protein [Slackia heliotrinireducens]|uniref:DUF3267 domain-containing protein n=1 Tax=Slackia heliotrinireducens TaxID=84110 RepID=UPI0033151AFF
MHLVYKGKFTGPDDLPVADMPERAVMFDEPDSLDGIAREAVKYTLYMCFPVVAVLVAGLLLDGTDPLAPQFALGIMLGAALSLVAAVPHEFLHAMCMPRGAQVELWTALRQGMLFVTTTHPFTKGRFIVMSALPGLVLGVIPCLVWLLIPHGTLGSAALFTFGASSFLMAAGDILNIANALRQVPTGGTVALSGIHSYWWTD